MIEIQQVLQLQILMIECTRLEKSRIQDTAVITPLINLCVIRKLSGDFRRSIENVVPGVVEVTLRVVVRSAPSAPLKEIANLCMPIIRQSLLGC